ncbi:MAG: Cu(I)-responsive transcriptional regulator [Rhodobacter sp.]|nr:Cu(I)-responsive transcriptional regulator [Rhodobacter sp.]MCA3459355.1 Cu(I)-responsive transcriptional regulator [Rhodobacter sp.]MCA3462606.1 Cu(I)-responsive transcriptional regulator [Rhodobacter sp.]MCA3464532.1 Cu(I)-responsive transcriptional regulator [Rhodobacter sp.]MCA3469169.1 Cu(I)-responsive transcriptional regulator [Rhodobacter sp.]
MNISEAARQAGLPAKTIRYYEDIGLVTPPRDPNGYRAFRPRDLHALTFVARARSLGFTIGECRALLHLYQDPTRASADVKEIARRHLGRIDAKLAELAALRATLTDLVDACAGDQRPDCPILKGLAATA